MAWRPGDLVLDDTVLAGPCSALTFGQGDPGFDLIAQKLASRNCTMVGQLRDWGAQEFISVIRGLKLKKHPQAYLAAMQIALVLKLEDKAGNDGDDVKVKTETGGDMMDRCLKIAPSNGFNPFNYDFDASLYDYLPAKGQISFLSDDNEKLALDLQWLYMNADPEPSLGVYLPDGMSKRLAWMHSRRLPPFPPKVAGVSKEQIPVDAKTKYKDRWQNGRNHAYKRIVLSEEYRSLFEEVWWRGT